MSVQTQQLRAVAGLQNAVVEAEEMWRGGSRRQWRSKPLKHRT